MNYLAHLFLPRESNNHKAKLIHSSSLVIITLVFILVQGIIRFGSSHGQVLGYAANINPSEVIRLTNIQRVNNGLGSLTDNPVLDKAALAKGTDMLNKGYWAHVAPDGTQPWAFFINANYDYKYAGENLARDFVDPNSAVNAWMASPSHRENILSSHYKEIGVAVVEGKLGGADTTIIVQFFGTKIGDTLPVAPVAKVEETKPQPSLTPVPTPQVLTEINQKPLVAGNQVNPFDLTRYLSIGVVGILIAVVALDGFLINRRKIFRIAGRYQAHFIFLGMILIVVAIAKIGRVI